MKYISQLSTLELKARACFLHTSTNIHLVLCSEPSLATSACL